MPDTDDVQPKNMKEKKNQQSNMRNLKKYNHSISCGSAENNIYIDTIEIFFFS